MDSLSASAMSTGSLHGLQSTWWLKIYLNRSSCQSVVENVSWWRESLTLEVEAPQSKLRRNCSVSRTSVYRHYYLLRAFRQMAGEFRACQQLAGVLVICLKLQIMQNSSSSLIHFIHSLTATAVLLTCWIDWPRLTVMQWLETHCWKFHFEIT